MIKINLSLSKVIFVTTQDLNNNSYCVLLILLSLENFILLLVGVFCTYWTIVKYYILANMSNQSVDILYATDISGGSSDSTSGVSEDMDFTSTNHTSNKEVEIFRNKTEECKFTALSNTLIFRIMEYLNAISLVQLSMTCKKFNELSYNPNLWSRLDLARVQFGPQQLVNIFKRNPTFLRLARTLTVEPQPFSQIPTTISAMSKAEFIGLQLTYLDLSYAGISTDTLAVLCDFSPNIRKLSLEGIALGLELFKKLTSGVDTLNLSMCSQFHLSTFCTYLKRTTGLRVLNIAWIQDHRWKPVDFNKLISHLPMTLIELDISGYPTLMTNFFVNKIALLCRYIERLNISDSYKITDEAIEHMFLLEELKHLSINRCSEISYFSLRTLKRMKQLKYLEIYGFPSSSRYSLTIMRKWLGININTTPFLSIARPTCEKRSYYLWNALVFQFNELNDD